VSAATAFRFSLAGFHARNGVPLDRRDDRHDRRWHLDDDLRAERRRGGR
jgi:hypothetical protein